MKMPLFRKYVGTSRHACKVRRPDGTSRDSVWENTNQLLGSNGFDGVKTGTTMTAGSCLVASGHRDSRHLITVVLGSKENEDRYADTRALFDWAVKNLAGSSH
jgi:D-alanyl-D-alanine carboxypeptidase (penicillin-binding protein 5/6)